MCGIVGYLNKGANPDTAVGTILLQMLKALCRRGPDSTGVAVFGESLAPQLVLRIKLGERGDFESQVQRLAARLAQTMMPLQAQRVFGEFLRVVVDPPDLQRLVDCVESEGSLEVVSLGHRLEIVKQVGSPDHLDRSYLIRSFRGTHGIGHTRLSTESRVDLSHSQPFWARGVPDLATVHNGHITNYHKLRRRYEQSGIRFCTENDSEIIGVYLRDQMNHGFSFEEALAASLDDFDGSFSYLAATADALAYVKDRFAFKPLVVAESEEFVALATEEIALRTAFPGHFSVFEPGARTVQLWSLARCAAQVT